MQSFLVYRVTGTFAIFHGSIFLKAIKVKDAKVIYEKESARELAVLKDTF